MMACFVVRVVYKFRKKIGLTYLANALTPVILLNWYLPILLRSVRIFNFASNRISNTLLFDFALNIYLRQ